MLLLLLLISCFSKQHKGFTKASKLVIDVRDKSGNLLSADLFLEGDRIYYPIKDQEGIYIFNVPNGIYRIKASKQGFNSHSSELEIINSSNGVEYKGKSSIQLTELKVLEKNISIVGSKFLELCSDNKIIRLEVKDGVATFTPKHIGNFTLNLGSKKHSIEVFVNNGAIEVKVDNKAANELKNDHCKLALDIELSESINSLYNDELIDISIDVSTPEKAKYEVVSSEYDIEERKLLLDVEFNLDFVGNLSPSVDFNIGNFSLNRSFFLFSDGSKLINRGTNRYLLDNFYSVKMLTFPISAKKINFEIESDNDIYFEIISNKLRIDSLGRDNITLKFISFEDILLNVENTFEEIELALDVKRVNYRKLRAIPNARIGPKIFDSKYDKELYAIVQSGNGWRIVEKMQQDNSLYFPFRINWADSNVKFLLLEREKKRVVRQRIFSVCDEVSFVESDMNYNFRFSNNYNDMFPLNGLIFININNTILQEFMNRMNCYISNLETVIFKFYVKKNNAYYEIKGGNLDIINKNNRYEFNFDPNYLFAPFGDVITLDLYRADKEFSRLNNPKPTIKMKIYAVSCCKDVEIDREIPIVDEENRVVEYSDFSCYSRVHRFITEHEESIKPFTSSQTFFLKMSYSEENTMLEEGKFYQNFLRDADGSSKIVMSSKNVAMNGRVGQNFHQLINLETDLESRGMFASSALGGLVSFFTGSNIEKILSVANIIFGSVGFFSSLTPEGKDSFNWDHNFVDSRGKKINGIRNSRQQNYASEWSMIVNSGNDRTITFHPVEMYGDVKIRVIRRLTNTLGEVKAEMIDSNFGSLSSETTVDVGIGWYGFSIRVDKVGKAKADWGVNIPMPFKIFRHKRDKLDYVEKSLVN